MSLYQCLNLANETWSTVFSRLALHDLASVSRVSKILQALAFPYLYHTVCLTVAEHLEALAERVESDVGGPLSLRAHIRGLIFDELERKTETSMAGKSLKDGQLGRLPEIVPKLSSLRHFSWEMQFFPQDMKLVAILQAANLNSVDWWVWQSDMSDHSSFVLEYRPEDFLEYVFIKSNWPFRSKHRDRLLKFKNLAHLALRVRQLTNVDFHEDFKDPIASCLIASPNLESLTLEFGNEYGGDGYYWDPDIILNTLGDFTFPFLRTFRALGFAYPSTTLAMGSISGPLAVFFIRHPNLHTVGMGWPDDPYSECKTPEGFAALLPSLKHLEGPVLLCQAILGSSLAHQLESVSIIDRPFDEIGITLGEVAESIQPLSNLRKLVIDTRYDETVEIAALQTIVKAAPNLRELKTRFKLDGPSQILELLKLASKLRVLDLHYDECDKEGWPQWLQTKLGVTTIDECVPVLVDVCPSLRCIGMNYGQEEDKFLIVERGVEGGVRVLESMTH